MPNDASLYLTDKTGQKCWHTHCTYGFHTGEENNMMRRLENAKAGKYSFLDSATVELVIEVDGVRINGPVPDVSHDELMKELGELGDSGITG